MLHRANHRRPLAIESLESRIALSGDGLEGLAWGNAPYLSLSFAPDGTAVDGRSSSLFAYMDAIGEQSEWQAAISSALQTWAIHTNADVAVVSDSGDEFGTPGKPHDDARFGDVRIGAIPLRPSVIAVGVSRGYTSGTWSGDIFFNTNVRLDSIESVHRVAMHEAGHVFGFEDNEDVTSVMYAQGIPQVTAPSEEDIASLQSRFGSRLPDQNELDDGLHVPNDTELTATRIRYESDGDDGPTVGSVPLIVHADLGATDVDVYRFQSFEGYDGSVTFEVRTAGLSQLAAQVVVRDENGMDHGSDNDASDGLRVRIPNPQDNLKYYVHLQATAVEEFAIGGYSLVTTFDADLTTPADVIDEFAGPKYRFLDQDDIQDVFAGDPEGEVLPFFGDDLHANDTPGTATELNESPGFAEGIKYEALASLSDVNDADHYAFKSPATGPTVMTVLVEGVDNAPLLADVQFVDEDGQLVASQRLVRHGGRVVTQITNISYDDTYLVRVQPGHTGQVGNYRMSIVSSANAEEFPMSFAGTLFDEPLEFQHRIRRPELLSLAYEGDGSGALGKARISIVDASGLTLHSFAAEVDGFASTDSILLSPGDYRIVVRPAYVSPQPVEFRVLAAIVTDPLAVPKSDSVNLPHVDAGLDEDFVFPQPDPAPHPPTNPQPANGGGASGGSPAPPHVRTWSGWSASESRGRPLRSTTTDIAFATTEGGQGPFWTFGQ